MTIHVIAGAGTIGSGAALLLAEQGHHVRLVSRSGRGPNHPRITTTALDLTHPNAVEDLSRIAAGAASLVNAMNPPYTKWPTEWPPLANTLLRTAEITGAGLVTVGNLYGYGRVDAPMREDQPFAPTGHKGATRAQMWTDALAAHTAGRVRATEIRGSDYFGPGGGRYSYLGYQVLRPAIAGKTVRLLFGNPDAAHSWTYRPDFSAAVAALATREPTSPTWGRPWHVPTAPPRSVLEALADLAEFTGQKQVNVSLMPGRTLLMRVVPILREFTETSHQFEHPYVVDSTLTQQTLGLTPTPWHTALAETVLSLGDRPAVPAQR